jgi:hypothetical protein
MGNISVLLSAYSRSLQSEFMIIAECILCGPKRKLKTIANFQINRNGHRLKSQNSINYLGIAIDQNLSGALFVLYLFLGPYF